MSRKIIIALLSFCLISPLAGCTSGGAKEESAAAKADEESFSEEGESDFADAEGEAESGDDAAAGTEEAAAGDVAASAEEPPPAEETADLNLDESPADAAQEPAETAATEPAPAAPAEKPLEDELMMDEGDSSKPESVAKADAGANAPAESAQEGAAENAPSDQSLFSDQAQTDQTQTTDIASSAAPSGESDLGSSSSGPAESADAATSRPKTSEPAVSRSFAPLLKIKDAAFTAGGGVTLNRVYLARPGDKLKAVSQKIYGTPDRSKDLMAWNSFLRRGVKAGDKIYYASPSNPSDTRMLTFYEEMNATPQVYVSKEGDNIRKLSKELLGFSDAWKEVWSTNLSVESKGDLPAGTELRYWTEVPSSVATATAVKGQLGTEATQALPPIAGSASDASAKELPGEPMQMDPMVPPGDSLSPPVAQAPSSQGQEQQGGLPSNTAEDPLSADPSSASGTLETSPDPLAPPPPPPLEAQSNQPTQMANPPPAPPKAPSQAGMEEESGAFDSDMLGQLMLLGAAVIGGAILIVVMRKRSAKRLDLGQTQV